MAAITDRIKHAWNAFVADEEVFETIPYSTEVSYGPRPDRARFSISNERSIVSSVYTRLSIDVASAQFHHVRLDENERYLEDIKSGLDNCFRVEANLDQAPSHFIQDIAMTMMNEGLAVVVPVDTTINPNITGGYDIKTLRVGTVVSWFPNHIRVRLYDERTGKREEILVDKKFVCVIENPLYTVMNEPNSTLQRLIHKLNLLDAIDNQSSSGKLDIIIQLPYVIKSEARRQQAEKRRKDIEFQLAGSKYGIAYTDGTEKITQLNRPAENNLMGQIEYLVGLLYSQLGLTESVMDGTADEPAMLNYHNRTIEPMVKAILEEMRRKFLTATARSQGQWIMAFKDPFKLVPISQIAEIADKFTRNEITASNEIRQSIGLKPSKDPKADQLRNSNMPQTDTQPGLASGTNTTTEGEGRE